MNKNGRIVIQRNINVSKSLAKPEPVEGWVLLDHRRASTSSALVVQGVATHIILLLVALLGLAACRPDEASSRAVSTDIVLTYQREGGIAGITQEWVIYPDGHIIGPGDQEMKVPPQEVIALLAEAAEIESSSLQESYIPEDACCDQFTYTITIKVGDQETTIQTSDGAEQPEQLTFLLTSIEELLAQAEPIQ